MKTERRTLLRTCIQCGEEYNAFLPKSRFCSSRCRSSYWRTNQILETQDSAQRTQNDRKTHSQQIEQPQADDSETVAGMQIAIDLLQYQADRWFKSFQNEQSAYEEELSKRENLENEVHNLRRELTLLKQRHAVETAQNKKPDTVEQLISGIGKLPTSILEQLIPIAGRLVNFVVPVPTADLSGTPDALEPLIEWIQNVPDVLQHRLLSALQKISKLPEPEQQSVVDQLHKYLDASPVSTGS